MYGRTSFVKGVLTNKTVRTTETKDDKMVKLETNKTKLVIPSRQDDGRVRILYISMDKDKRWETVNGIISEQQTTPVPKHIKQQQNKDKKRQQFKQELQNQKQKHEKRIPETQQSITEVTSVQDDEWRFVSRKKQYKRKNKDTITKQNSSFGCKLCFLIQKNRFLLSWAEQSDHQHRGKKNMVTKSVTQGAISSRSVKQ
jgi:hypothetical protein